jgi:hypothetical protein
MLTVDGLLTGLHESHHVAMVLYLGREVVSVNRKAAPGQHGQVIWKGSTPVQAQMIYLAPAVAMLGETPLTHFNYDCREALKLGSLAAAVILVQEAQRDARYRRMMNRCWSLLNGRLELTADDIAEVRGA